MGDVDLSNRPPRRWEASMHRRRYRLKASRRSADAAPRRESATAGARPHDIRLPRGEELPYSTSFAMLIGFLA